MVFERPFWDWLTGQGGVETRQRTPMWSKPSSRARCRARRATGWDFGCTQFKWTQSISRAMVPDMRADDVLRLDRQICFLLYGASRAVTQLYQPLLEPLGLTYPQYLVMLVLWEEERASVGRLSERLYLDSGTLTPLLKRLEAAGLVRRQRSTDDERVVDVFLTPAGKQLKRDARRVPEALACRVGLAGDELARLRRELVHFFETTRGQVKKQEK